MSVNGSPERRERRNACSMRSSSSTRFGRPVSGSRSASECALSSRQLRNTPTAAAKNAQRTSAAATWSGVSRKIAVSRLAPSTSAARDSAHANVLLSCRRLVLIVTRRRSAPSAGAAAGLSDSTAGSSSSSPPVRGTGIPRRRERGSEREDRAAHRGIEHRGSRCGRRRVAAGRARRSARRPDRDERAAARPAAAQRARARRGSPLVLARDGAPRCRVRARLRLHARSGCRRRSSAGSSSSSRAPISSTG